MILLYKQSTGTSLYKVLVTLSLLIILSLHKLVNSIYVKSRGGEKFLNHVIITM